MSFRHDELARPRMTPERERNLFRLHQRLHPNGRFQSSARECEICMLFDLLDDTRSELRARESDLDEMYAQQ